MNDKELKLTIPAFENKPVIGAGMLSPDSFLAYKLFRISSIAAVHIAKRRAYLHLINSGFKLPPDDPDWKYIDEPSEYYANIDGSKLLSDIQLQNIPTWEL